MSGLDQLKNTFFEECGELLIRLETDLADIRQGTGTDDTVHSIFRAVHSIKGGAGVFGFAELIEFAHAFETVLDVVRRGELDATPEIVDIMLRANDTLADFVTMARESTAVDPGFGAECLTELNNLIGNEGEEGPAPAELEGLAFTPVRVDDFDDGAASNTRQFSIVFRPKPDMLRNGLDPLFFLDMLRSLGKLDLAADVDAIPPLMELAHDDVAVGWTGCLETTSDRGDVEMVLAPAAQHCDLDIVDLTAQDFSAPEAASVESAAGTEMPPPASEPPASAPEQMKAADKAETRAPEAEKAAAAGSSKAAAATTIRVELEKIDRVVNMVGELVIAQAMLGQVIDDLPEQASGKMVNILADLVRHTRGLKDSVMAIRAQPVGSVFQRMPRLVRELSAKTGKKVQLEMFGESTEVDKTIIERLSDPLTHIIRNSIDHGIETPADRVSAGKDESGTIRLSADQRGGRIVIEVSDDGGGINCERVLRKAKEKKLVDPNVKLTDEEICNLIFMPGFSTAETISDISGRGVGMDVVRRNIQDLGGRTSIRSELGRGTTIQLALPLTLAVMDGMVVKVASQTYVLPIPNIVECLRPGPNEIRKLLGTAGTLQLRGDIIPVIHLGDLLGMASRPDGMSEGVVIITENSEGARIGLLVDELCGHQQVVIKSIEENCGTVHGIAGATVLGDGHVAFILDVEALSEMSCTELDRPGVKAA